MPHTVPSRPTNGAVEPTVASRTCPNCSLCSTACRASRSTRVNCCDRSPAAASVPVNSTLIAAINGLTSPARSNANTLGRASSMELACQNAAVLRATSPRARCKSQAFHKITTQLLTDMANSSSATSLVTASPCVIRSSRFMSSPAHQTCHTGPAFAPGEIARRARPLARRWHGWRTCG